MENQVKVLNLWASPFGLRVLVGLEEKGVKYEYQEENLASKSELLLKMNPIHKKIPVLIHNDKPVLESLIIVEYIDEAWPNTNPFMPSSAYERARARFWADFVDNQVFQNPLIIVEYIDEAWPTTNPFMPSSAYERARARFWANFADKKIYDNGGALIMKCKGEAQEEAKRNMLEYLGLLEGALDELSGGIKPYFGGEKFGYMDIAFIPFASWFQAWEVMGNWKIPLETQFPRLHEWVNACMERESVKKVLPRPEKLAELLMQFTQTFVGSD